MKNPSVYYMGDRPYDNYEEYLEDLFAEMDIFLAKSANQELPFLRKRLKARGLNREQNIEDWQKMIGERRDFSLAVGIALPLEEVLSAVKGDSFVRSILVLSMLMALQKGYADVLRALFADSQGQLEAASCVRPIEAMAKASADFVELSHNAQEPSALSWQKPQIACRNELYLLADSIADMTGDMVNYMQNLTRVTADKERISAELSVATQIQESMIPKMYPAFPERPEFDIYGHIRSARQMGGAFFKACQRKL